MPRTRKWIGLGLLLAAPLLLAQTAAPDAPTAPHHRKSHRAHKALQPLVLPPMPRGPLSQLPMDQIPPSPAKVSYQNGLLTISAQNSPLGEILRDVRNLTGATIDVPAGSGANERVVTQLGPGTPRDVLVGLLNGTSFNYVMMGTSADPASIASIILTSKPSATGEVQTAAANVYQTDEPAQNRFPMQPMRYQQNLIPAKTEQQPGGVQAAPADADDSKDDDDSADDNADDQAQPGQPGQPDASASGVQGAQPDPNQPNAGPRTPEQILDMLRRQQGQQNPLVGNPGGQQPPQQ